jgi:hypothetical protein
MGSNTPAGGKSGRRCRAGLAHGAGGHGRRVASKGERLAFVRAALAMTTAAEAALSAGAEATGRSFCAAVIVV